MLNKGRAEHDMIEMLNVSLEEDTKYSKFDKENFKHKRNICTINQYDYMLIY